MGANAGGEFWTAFYIWEPKDAIVTSYICY